MTDERQGDGDLTELAEFLLRPTKDFVISPFFNKLADTICLYLRDEPSYARVLNDEVTVFLSEEDDSLVGFELTNASRLLSRDDP